MSRILRLSRYASWNAADQVITLGVPRLILFPILGAMLGEDTFGTFVIALGLINIVGLSPSNGLVGYIIRDLVKQDDSSQPLLLRTSLTLSLATTLPFTLFFIFGAQQLSGLYQNNAGLMRLLPWLGAYLLLTNIVETSLTMQRVRRNFHISALVHTLQSAVLFSAIPLYRAWGEQGIAIAYVIATTAALIASISSERSTYLRTPIYAGRFAKAAMRVWPAFSISAFISLSAGYLDRLVLGYWWSPAVVAPFFAAVSTASMFAVPGVQASNLMLSMLGKFERKDQFDRRFYSRYAWFIGAWTMMAFIVGVFLGSPILTLLYPRYVEQALPLWSYAVAAFALSNVPMLCRPFVSKFLNPNLLPALSTISLIARIIPLVILVPTGGKHGAVLALLIGSAITALAWLLLYLRHFVLAVDVSRKSIPSHSKEASKVGCQQ